MTRRRPSVAKQRRLTARPRCATRATGCRWPAISPSARRRGWFVAQSQRAERQRFGEAAADICRQIGIVIAGDPEPVASALERPQRGAIALLMRDGP